MSPLVDDASAASKVQILQLWGANKMVVQLLAASTVCIALGQAAVVEETPVDADASDQTLQFMSRSVTDYEIETAADASESVDLHPAPILRWNNPISGVRDGIISMWTIDDRPAVLAQVFVTRDEIWLHEFQSVAEEPLIVSKAGSTLWAPTDVGAEMQPVPDAQAPAMNPPGRLVQMRRLARRFSATSLFRINSTDPESSPYNLRLMSRPLYRYGAPQSAIMDGALFAFAQGTNPEVWLLLESRQTDAGPKWYYGLAPMTGYAVRADLDRRTVLEVDEQQMDRRPDKAYFHHTFCRRVVARRDWAGSDASSTVHNPEMSESQFDENLVYSGDYHCCHRGLAYRSRFCR